MSSYGIKGAGLTRDERRRRISSVRSSTLSCEMLEERRVLNGMMKLGDNVDFVNIYNDRSWLPIRTMTSPIVRLASSTAVDLHSITITRPWDLSSPFLLEACAKGVEFPQAGISMYLGNGSPQLQCKLYDVSITAVTVAAGDLEYPAVSAFAYISIQTLTVSYKRAEWSSVLGTQVSTTTSSNQGPTDITLLGASVAENQQAGAYVGAFGTTDTDPGGSFTCTLVAGTGSTDNSSFSIVNGELRAAATFDFETRNSYSIRVRSTDQDNLFVEKAFTISVTDTLDLPGVPTSIVATIEGGQANVTWVAPSSDGGTAVMGYVVNYRSDTDLAWRRVPGVSSTNTTTIPALPTGASYIFRVAAVNAVGRGSFSGHSNSIALPSPEPVVATAFRQVDVLGVAAFATAPSTGPTTAPWAVGLVTATARNGRAALRWRLPLSDGNSPITGYVIEYQKVGGDGQWIRFASTETTARTAVVNGLQNGEAYRFRVAARNAVGVGRFSPESASVTPGVPVVVS